MTLPIWINLALTSGPRRTLMVVRVNESIWAARINLNDSATGTISGSGPTPSEALNALNTALTEDAAQEMRDNPNSGV